MLNVKYLSFHYWANFKLFFKSFHCDRPTSGFRREWFYDILQGYDSAFRVFVDQQDESKVDNEFWLNFGGVRVWLKSYRWFEFGDDPNYDPNIGILSEF